MTADDGDEGRGLAEQQWGFAAQALGRGWRIARALSGGYQQGALLVEAADGTRGVFKLAHDGDTTGAVEVKARVINRAIRDGWPAAPWIAWGTTKGQPWFVQAFASGRPVETVSLRTEHALLNAVSRQKDPDELAPFDWTRQTLDVGTPSSYWHDRCRAFGGSAYELASLVSATHSKVSSAPPPSTDLVHGDFATDNILEHEGEITIIDTQSVGRGSRAIDLAAMAVHCLAWDQTPECAPRFFSAAAGVAGDHAALFASGRALGALVFSMDHYPGFVETMARRILAVEAFTGWP